MIKFREHFLVIGASGAGKGMFTNAQAREWLNQGMRVYALFSKPDEYEDFFPGHKKVFKTMDQFRLYDEIQTLKAPAKGYVDTMVIIDEAWAWSWKGKKGLQMVANAGRSYGVELWVQTQFPTQCVPTVRQNCRNRFVFTLDEPGAVDWVTRCLGDEFSACTKLPLGKGIGKMGHGDAFVIWSWYIDKTGKFIRA